jgi:hypothetical protein
MSTRGRPYAALDLDPLHPLDEVQNNDRTPTYAPPFSLKASTSIALASSDTVDRDKRQRHTEKLISHYTSNGKKTKMPIGRTEKHRLPSTPRHSHEGRDRCGSRVKADLLAEALLPPPQQRRNKP